MGEWKWVCLLSLFSCSPSVCLRMRPCPSLSDGMTVFSPVSSARYRRSSVSINPSCPSQVSVCNLCSNVRHHFLWNIDVSGGKTQPGPSISSCLAPPPGSYRHADRHSRLFLSPARPSVSLLSDRRPTGPEEAGEDGQRTQSSSRCLSHLFIQQDKNTLNWINKHQSSCFSPTYTPVWF